MSNYAIGVDVGGTYIKIGLVHRKNGVVESIVIPTHSERGFDKVVSSISRGVVSVMRKVKGILLKDIMGVGIGVPGMVSLDRRFVSNPPNLGWGKQIPLSAKIEERFGKPCWLDNDANMYARGSMEFGSGKGVSSFVMLTLGTGVGGSIVIDRKIYRGTTGAAAELGHCIIETGGAYSLSVTRGTVEAYLGQRFLCRHAQDILIRYPQNPLYAKYKGDFSKLTPEQLSIAAQKGNTVAKDILYRAGEKLGYGIVNYIHILDIRTIIVGGGVSKAGNLLLEPARIVANRCLMPPFKKDFTIIRENLDHEAALLGAALLVFDNL